MQLTRLPETTDPFDFTYGNSNAEILIISEYFSVEEAHQKRPLAGASGFEFRKICNDAGLDITKALFAVCAAQRPAGGDVRGLFYPTAEKKTRTAFRGLYPTPALRDGFDRIQLLIKALPNLKLIIGLGNLPLWMLTDVGTISTFQGYKIPGGVSKWRGSQLYHQAADSRRIPYLPIIHPTTILKDWSSRFPTVHDLKARAVRYLNATASWERDKTVYFPSPSFEEAQMVLHRWEAKLSLPEGLDLCADIETWRRSYIACIGLADAGLAICIPFFYFSPEGKILDYWTEEQEIELWLRIRTILSHPRCRVIGQNFIYDTQFLSRHYFITPNLAMDTMLAHHLLWPGTPKGLDYLASLYCSHYIYWKDESQDWDGQFEHESLWLYNCKDVRETFDIAVELRELISKLKREEHWAFQLEQWHLAWGMMKRGTNTNRRHFEQMNIELTKVADTLEATLLAYMPEDLRYTSAGGPWYSSPKHQMTIFYDILGLKPVLHKKTKRPTLDASAIAVLKERETWLSPLFQALEDLRSVGVFRSHFLQMKLSFDGRIRCNFNVGGTETFRWSSSANGFGEGTNLQNVPKGDD